MVARLTGGAVAYGLVWAVGVPALLLWWARATAEVVPLRTLHIPAVGAAFVAVGLLFIALGMSALAVHGRGLPMNAYPPPHYVERGVYGWLSHPIYVGFVTAAIGTSVFFGSASGLWLVTPVAAFALAALVMSYEWQDLGRRFGNTVRRARLALPQATEGTPRGTEVLSVYVLVLIPWLIAYEALHFLGIPPDAVPSYLPFEREWPVLEWTEAIYVTAYVVVPLTPLLLRSRLALRRFAVTGLIATAVATLIYITVPLIAPPRPFQPNTALGRLLVLERAVSNTVAAFPAFHVLWALIAADALRSRGKWWGLVAYAWAVLLAASCITTGMHSLADVIFAGILFIPLRRYDSVWDWIRRGAERLANSWREWRVGPVRIINYGFYTAAGGLVGTWLASWLLGPEMWMSVAAVAIAGLMSSAIWAQFVEGSPRLLRPLGYYGGIFGGLLATGVLAFGGMDVIPFLGAFAVALPWVQAAGRLRCLVQGCCHGAPASVRAGISYRHPRSRVTQIAGWAGVPLYPTPLY